ncbi:hypothetical protein Bca4012_056195 [Brassica carinata]
MRELVLRLGPSGRGAAAMRIFVVNLTGKSHTLEVNKSDTIGEVKIKWEEIHGIPVKDQTIIFSGKQLKDSWTLAECHIKHESTINIMSRLCGC